MIDYTSVEGKAGLECYTLEDFLQETLELGAKGYKLCLENDYFCFNRGGNYTAYFDAPAADSPQVSEQVVNLSTTDATAFLAALGFEEEEALVAEADRIVDPEVELAFPHSDDPRTVADIDRQIKEQNAWLDNTPSDVNTAAEPPVQEEVKEPAPDVKEETTDAPAPRRGRPPRNAT